MVRKDHVKQVGVGKTIKSGSFLREGAVLVVCGVGWLTMMDAAACLDQALDPLREVVSGNGVRVEVELLEDDFGDGSLHRVVPASVEALRVGEERECRHEEAATGFEFAGGVGELGLYLGALTLDGGQLALDLLSRPIRVIEQVEQVVFLGVELVQASAKPPLEFAHAAVLHEKGVVQLLAHLGLKGVRESHRAEVSFNGPFDLVDGQVRQIADVFLSASAEEVEVDAAVALSPDDDHAVPTAVAPQ